MTPCAPLRIRVAQATHPGLSERINEDAVLCLPERGVFCIADGIGGEADGQEAGHIVVTTLAERLAQETLFLPLEDTVGLVRQALDAASYRIHDRAEERGVPAMGSTVVALVLSATAPSTGCVFPISISRMFSGTRKRSYARAGKRSSAWT